ncbi:DUF2461 domain-containing protein [Georgenia subflava]|uniref:DUF2461 family protein n=1 Tax=Georgenia subflava TaxID=1622177 RepID=A0A6N7EMF9_9MICO|nr:DUF2461 domain-containing protein [Georgenia subflava]MPV37326.1 DUF2461 family protein [Georgenia subflava]
MGDFTGFSPWGPQFYSALEGQNTHEYWTANKDRWQREVRDPMRALAAALEPEFGPLTVRRPNRDLRFSADRSPYKTHQGVINGPSPGLGFYLHLDADGLAVGGGFRSGSAAQTARFRRAVDEDADGVLPAIVGDLVARGYSIEGASVKTRPRGYRDDHPRIGLLRRKELMAISYVGQPTWLRTPTALDHVRAAWREVRPLADWLDANVGTD